MKTQLMQSGNDRLSHCVSGGASDPGERLGVYVEREAWLHPHLPLKPGHRTQGRRPRQAAPAEQGEFNICYQINKMSMHMVCWISESHAFKAQALHCVY